MIKNLTLYILFLDFALSFVRCMQCINDAAALKKLDEVISKKQTLSRRKKEIVDLKLATSSPFY